MKSRVLEMPEKVFFAALVMSLSGFSLLLYKDTESLLDAYTPIIPMALLIASFAAYQGCRTYVRIRN